ncbi:MAG: IS66 family insertion sequence element accessory protein TnpB [Rubrivivax sp.]|nr:IS66 family insertion sequence element accessory protein TnpB [Rubrivivax sp.]
MNERAWRELFRRFDGAGLTVEAFCQREGLSRSSFNRWRSRLPMRAGAAAAVAVNASDARQSAAAFVDLGLLGAASGMASVAGVELRLDLGGGLSLTLVRR